MGTGNPTYQCKHDAVAQMMERGHPIKEVSERLGGQLALLNAGRRKFGKMIRGGAEKDAEIYRLKRKLARCISSGNF
jgi:transposase